MDLFKYIYYYTCCLIFKIRERIPLFSNDHAKINSVYAFSLLKIFQSPSLSLEEKQRFFRIFAKNFSMPISISRMAKTLYCDPRSEEFLKFLSANKNPLFTQYLRQRVISELETMPKNASPTQRGFTRKLTHPLMPDFSASYTQLTYDKKHKYFMLNATEGAKIQQANTGTAILCLPEEKFSTDDLKVLEGYDNIIIIPDKPHNAAEIIPNLKSALGSHVSVSFYDPKEHHVLPYSKSDADISKECDKLGNELLAMAFNSLSVRRFIPEKLDEDLALEISDILYRPVRQFYAVFEAIIKEDPRTPIYFNGPASAMPRTLARIERNPVFILTNSSGLAKKKMPQQTPLKKPCSPEMTKNLYNFIKGLRKQLETSLSFLPAHGSDQIFIAASTQSRTYIRARKLIEERLSEIAPVIVFDFAAPVGFKNIVKGSLRPFLHSAMHSRNSGQSVILSHSIQKGCNMLLNDRHLLNIPMSELNETISFEIEKNISALIGNVILYRLMIHKLRKFKNSQLLLLPGRYGSVRCLARAFEETNLKSLDVQILLVSEMSRYKAPMASRSVVIDSYTRDRYIESWNQPPDSIEMIGAINLDEDIKEAQSYERGITRKFLLGASQGQTVTFACQPLPDTEIQAAVKAITKAVKKRPHLHLCVKLHPSQSEALLVLISDYLMQEFQDKSRFTVLKTVSFAKVMPVTDILVSYFSNVCLMAPAFNVPVITLPSSAPMPSLTLADMGLAVAAKTLDDFEGQLERVLSRASRDDESLPPHPYLKKNPHMMVPNSLGRLVEVVKKGFK